MSPAANEDRETMGRLPLQVLVIPFRIAGVSARFAIFRRTDAGYWQWIAGGVEQDETPEQAAARELEEEAGVAVVEPLIALDAASTIPACHFVDSAVWGPSVLVVPELSFAASVGTASLRLSSEHSEFRWVDFDTAMSLLRWDSNKTALWELNQRLRKSVLGESCQ